jgi:hypothetical protein
MKPERPKPDCEVHMKRLLTAALVSLMLLGAAGLALADGDCGSKVKSTKTADATTAESVKSGG